MLSGKCTLCHEVKEVADISSLVLFFIFDGNINLTAHVCEACFYELQKYKGGIRSKDGKTGLKLIS